MAKSGFEGNQAPRFTEVFIPEMDIDLDGDAHTHTRIRQIALDLGYTVGQLLYRGLDRSDLNGQGRFVHTREELTLEGAVWAFTDDEFASSADKAARLGGRDTDSPIFYALDAAQPALAVMNRDLLIPAAADQEHQYVPVPGSSLEDSLIAVVTFTP